MFLSITDSVMNSHIYCIDVLLQLKFSVELSNRSNILFKPCNHSI